MIINYLFSRISFIIILPWIFFGIMCFYYNTFLYGIFLALIIGFYTTDKSSIKVYWGDEFKLPEYILNMYYNIYHFLILVIYLLIFGIKILMFEPIYEVITPVNYKVFDTHKGKVYIQQDNTIVDFVYSDVNLSVDDIEYVRRNNIYIGEEIYNEWTIKRR